MRKTKTKFAAVIACVALLALSVPMFASTNLHDYIKTINVPGEMFSAIFFFLSPANTIGFSAAVERNQGNSVESIRTTGEIPIHRTGAGD